MLKGINLLEYTFADGKLIYKNILKKEAESVSQNYILISFLVLD